MDTPSNHGEIELKSSECRRPSTTPSEIIERAPFWRRWNIAPHLSQQAAQYNLSSSAIAFFIMNQNIYTEPDWAKQASNAIGFIGAAVGMLFMGVCGDLFGRRKALLFTLSLCAIGVLIAGCSAGSVDVTYALVIVGKFISGVGAGGLYPLGGCLAVEEARGLGARKVDTSAWVLSNQVLGKTWPYVMALIFSQCSHQVRGKYWMTLLGTGGTWFLFDVANYGIELATPDVAQDLWGKAHDIPAKAGEALAILYFGAIGALLSIFWIRKRWSIKWLEVTGFVLSGVTFLFTALAYKFDWDAGVKFTLLGLLQVTLMIPNVTTYVAPLLSFPTQVRCSYHGWSAFAGKLGAAAGAYAVPAIASTSWGYEGVFWVMMAVCFIGSGFTFFFLEDPPCWEDFLASDLTDFSNEKFLKDKEGSVLAVPTPTSKN